MNMLKGDRKYWETYDGGIAFYKYGVKTIWFMFAVLKNWVVSFILFLQLGKKIQETYWILKKMQRFNCIF